MVATINQWLDNFLSNGFVLTTIFVLWVVFCVQKRVKVLVYLRYVLMIGSFIFLLVKNNFVFGNMIATWGEIWFFTYAKWFIGIILLAAFNSGLYRRR